MARPPFRMLRAAFLLLAAVIATQVVTILAGSVTCFYLFIAGPAEPGNCSGFSQVAREIWAEALATILALLLARDSEPPTKGE